MNSDQTHERLSSSEEGAKIPSERSFGTTFAAVFVIFGVFPLVYGNTPRWWSLGIGAVFLVVSFVAPAILRGPNKLWFMFGQVLHKFVSPIILGAMYFLAFTPMALLLKLFGKKLLNLTYNPEVASYWIERIPPGPSSDSVRKQF